MKLIILIFSLLELLVSGENIYGSRTINNNVQDVVRVNKCCEPFEILVGSRCTHVNETDSTEWKPIFTSTEGLDNVQVTNFKLAIGLPVCSTTQQWQVYHYDNSIDKLLLLPTGTLRHYIHHETAEDVEAEPVEGQEPRYHDYTTGQYCLDKVGPKYGIVTIV